jgi:pimeloyl-ACP methyl ester carboxylesterase
MVDGNPAGPTLLFVHGWPDDASLWRKQVAALQGEYRCVQVTLPNFGAEAVRAGGFDFTELRDMLLATLDEVQPEGRVTLVTHDWGAYLGYLLEQTCPER